MKRNYYLVKSYNGAFEKVYRNYQSAVNKCNKLIAWNIDCGIYTYDESNKLICLIGC